MQFTKHKASCVLEYNDMGYLIKYDFEPGTFDQDEYKLFFSNFPITEPKIETWRKQGFKTLKIEKIEVDLSFDAFYEKYSHKVGKRSRAEKIWETMNENERAKAIAYIYKYERYIIQSGVNKKHAESYLNSEIWNN